MVTSLEATSQLCNPIPSPSDIFVLQMAGSHGGVAVLRAVLRVEDGAERVEAWWPARQGCLLLGQ